MASARGAGAEGRHPGALRLIETIGRRVVQGERQLEALAFKTVVPRLADFLQRESRGELLEGVEIGRRRILVIDRERLARIALTG